ncbi:hypothetical protein RRF57_008471 [Xylaria bambusicola]|uniref:Uncharacterized protein n=1 Tax=Xylaria bambusicola TaxID=326684 RepID=A0AAN7UPG9_9PEZI
MVASDSFPKRLSSSDVKSQGSDQRPPVASQLPDAGAKDPWERFQRPTLLPNRKQQWRWLNMRFTRRL